MGYQVLARKYRPQRFADVYGQDHVTRTLTNALTQNRIAHGYIFSGHRGIGKTTIARILAMALDCRTAVGTPERPTVEPCLQCVSCREIASGGNAQGDTLASNSFDFIEIDAASNRGIDDVRSICAQADVRPARDKYKIFLLDEAHQITDAAFNAILKTLEEPPDWAIFMMATTEPESIPQTIRSRCQHFSFHAVKFDDILAQLRIIADKENVRADDQALALLAEAGDGSMRDALSIMDQAIASAPLQDGVATLDAAQIRDLMGAVPNAVFERLLEAVSAQQPATLMEELDRLIGSGNSPSALARQLVRYLRNCLMAKLGGEKTPLLAIAQDERARAFRTAQLFTEDELTRNLQIALRTFDELNYRQEQRFHLELGLLKLIQAQRLLPVEELLSGLGSANRPAAASRPASSLSPANRPATTQPSQAPNQPASRSVSPPLSPFSGDNQLSTQDRIPARVESSPSVPRSEATVTQIEARASIPEGAGGFSPRLRALESEGASAPETATQGPITAGALALAAPDPNEEIARVPQVSLLRPGNPAPDTETPNHPGPQIVPNPAPATRAIDPLREAVVEALTAAGHATAAVLLEDGQWTLEGSSIRIAVQAKATMIRLTFNPAAEKLIRQALTHAGAPGRFLIVPGENATSSGSAPRVRAPQGSIEQEARSNPWVQQAQSLFNAEIITVIDLRT